MRLPATRALLLHAAALEDAPRFDVYKVALYDTRPAEAAEVYIVTGAQARALFRAAWTAAHEESNTMAYRAPAAPPEPAAPPPETDRQADARETWQTHRMICRECKTATCQRGHTLLFEYALTLTPAPAAPGARQRSPFFQHLDQCDHCRANVHNLCPAGEAALSAAAAEPPKRGSRDAADAAALDDLAAAVYDETRQEDKAA